MVISQLCTKAKLVPEKLQPMIKLILLKMDKRTMKESVDTLVVICQRQEITSFSLKYESLSIFGTSWSCEELELWSYMRSPYLTFFSTDNRAGLVGRIFQLGGKTVFFWGGGRRGTLETIARKLNPNYQFITIGENSQFIQNTLTRLV